MDTHDLHQALNTCALELAYEKCLHQCKLIQENEAFRKSRVQLLLLESENKNLHMQIAEDGEFIRETESNYSALRARIRQTQLALDRAQGVLRIKVRDIETLKAELSSLHGVTMDSTKLLTEKLTLARELSNLRPEIDHLRRQAASNERLIAEKLSLEHQLGTSQLELEAEKKSMHRVLAREGKARVTDAEIESQLQVLQAELSGERRARQQSEREAQQASSIWEGYKTTLESRLESLKNKLKATKDSLDEAQRELQNARATAKPTVDTCSPTTYVKKVAANPRKRTATQVFADSMIGTPGDVPVERRRKLSSALPGDKSTFSITPYLNRTVSVAPESPTEFTILAPDGADVAEAADPAQDGVSTKNRTAKAPTIQRHQRSKAPALDTTKNRKSNLKAARDQGKPNLAARLEKVAEEEQGENGDALDSRGKAIELAVEDQSILRGGEAKKKKRKVLGSLSDALFDEEDRGTPKAGQGSRTLGSLIGGFPVRSKSRPLLAASSTSGNGFGAFSPLKRNIRASNIGA
ncbi:MAG: hypothetical protein L6R35_002218 [Caloplaca aegaea]|nr:MAG: hypothetical protein L6R35_002218 [Caloplaca aegaea]